MVLDRLSGSLSPIILLYRFLTLYLNQVPSHKPSPSA